MNPKLNSAVSVVKISDSILEFFKTNTRQQIHIKVQDDTIMDIAMSLDGSKSIDEIASMHNIKREDLEKLIIFLKNRGILDNIGEKRDFIDYSKYRRTIHFLADYSSSHENLLEMWNNIIESTVLIIGVGAVGSWVACNLAESGVRNFILIDPDKVEISNLHRQFGYSEQNIGEYKVDVMEKRLKDYNQGITVKKIKSMLGPETLKQFANEKIDLIINCADKPNVDSTSYWVGQQAMEYGIPHIIGGGYNLHLSLIGQTVIPGKSACVNCFKKQLEEDNQIDSQKVKKLAVRNRKVGSFGPMCSIMASMIGMESLKILSKEISPANVNRRGEFDIYTMNIKYKNYERREDCEWCGKKGLYYCT